MRLMIITIIFLLNSAQAFACATKSELVSKKKWAQIKREFKVTQSKIKKREVAVSPAVLNQLPQEGGIGNQSPWGGGNPSRWRAEAIMANAASKALNSAWSMLDVKDVSVAIPTQLFDSGFHPYGDGQSNSRVDFSLAWGQPRPQVVATLVQFNSTAPKVYFRFDRTIQRDALVGTPSQIEIYFKKNGQGVSLKLPLVKDSLGDYIAEWSQLPMELSLIDSFNNNAILVRPQPFYKDWFPIFFRHPVRSVNSLIKASPQVKTKFTGSMSNLSLIDKNGNYQDPLKIGSLSLQSGKDPFSTLVNFQFPQGYNQSPYNPQNIHAEFGAGGTVTGVGQGWTWVAEDKQARPFKIMYTCFEKRNLKAEEQARDGGVASGGGWHSINNATPGVDGDVAKVGAAEIIINSLEREALVVAGGYAGVLARTGLSLPNNTESVSYGLNDVVVIRWLQPGEGFITTAGISQPNHHWYFFAQNRNVCTEEWVGQCGVDFSCE